MNEKLILKLVTEEDWNKAKAKKVFEGSALDKSDGFLHFSTVDTIEGTARLYYKGQKGILLVTARSDAFGTELKWEAASGSARSGRFPHLYSHLPLEKVVDVIPCPLMPDDHIRLPPQLVGRAQDCASPPSPLSSGCPTPPSPGRLGHDNDCASPPSPLSSGCPTPPSVEEEEGEEEGNFRRAPARGAVVEDPPLVIPTRSQSAPPPSSAPPSSPAMGGSLVESLLLSSSLLAAYSSLVIEMTDSDAVFGFGIVSFFSWLYFAVGVLGFIKCPLKLMGRANIIVALSSLVLGVKWFFALSLIISSLVAVALISIPPQFVLAINIFSSMLRRHKNR